LTQLDSPPALTCATPALSFNSRLLPDQIASRAAASSGKQFARDRARLSGVGCQHTCRLPTGPFRRNCTGVGERYPTAGDAHQVERDRARTLFSAPLAAGSQPGYCVGLLVPGLGLNASFAHANAQPGKLAFVSQSGALVTAVLDWANARGIGFSHFISVGERADVDFADLIDYLGNDPGTRAILVYIESFKTPRKFLSAARAAARNKPVIVVKSGRTQEAARAAASHTGALAGADDVFDAAVARAGMLRVQSLLDLFVAVESVARAPRLAGDRLLIVTNGGGAGVLAADAAALGGARLAKLSASSLARLDAVLPPTWSHANPVDIIGDAPVGRYVETLKLRARCPRIAEIPFDSAHKFQASFHHDGDTVRLHVKGAPDVLLARASRQLAAGGDAPVDAAHWQAENEALASQAMRVLAVASKTIPARDFDPAGDLMQHVGELSFVGLVGIIDPPRPEARDAIALCKRAGIQVKMITGDHRITAAAIARELGLDGEVIEGRELEAMSAQALAHRIDRIGVFARVAPEHKVRIVQALKADGHVTAMTGDGVNDAPALKNADIGVAMGITGTEVTKEAATMVLTGDNFATIVRAVKEGRAIYDNIVKFVRFQLSTNMGAIQSVLGASLLGWRTPFTAIQILWVNIIMDGPPAMSLGVEPARPGVMDEAPRRTDARILTAPRLGRLFLYVLTMAVGTLALFHCARPQGEAYALTLAFTSFVLFQFFNVFNARAEHGTAFNRNFFRNRWLWLSLAAVVSLQALVVHWTPAQSVFGTIDLALADWGLAAAVASSVLLLDEARKLALRLYGFVHAAAGRSLHARSARR
jgi:phosphoserine phosphatase